MLDLALTAFVLALLALGLRRPFVWVLAYIYVDVLAPQKISWALLASIPLSLIVFVAAFGGWLLIDQKRFSRFTFRQALIALLLAYCGYTTMTADFPVEAAEKWAWVWKALVFAVFLPLTLWSRLRIEAATLVMALTVGAIVISGGIKTALGGGGYGMLPLFVNDNTGIYESSIISCAAIAIIPLVVWLMKHGTVFPPDWRVRVFCAALVFACMLMPVGTQARTGLICIAVLCVLALRTAKRRVMYGGLMAAAALMALPFLPQSFTARMSTIENHQADSSAGTRLAVWQWTWDYVDEHPLGGGFEAYLANEIRYNRAVTTGTGNNVSVEYHKVVDKGRAYHSSYFEMLGEQGWPGFILWIWLQALGLIQMELIRRRWPGRTGANEQWQAPLANALQQAQAVYLVGSLFVGIAFMPFAFMLIGLQCALWSYVRRLEKAALPGPNVLRASRPLQAPAAG